MPEAGGRRSPAALNAVQWRPGGGGHVESFFLKLNVPEEKIALWIKFTIYAPASAPQGALGETWAIFFDAAAPERNFAAKASFPLNRCRFSRRKLAIKTPAAQLSEGKTAGELFTAPGGKKRGTRPIRWELTFRPEAPPLVHFPAPILYRLPFPRSKAVSPFPHARFSGWFEVHGKRYHLVEAPGMQGHNWGKEHAHRYAWGHANTFAGKPQVYFEGVSASVRMGPIQSPFITLCFLRTEDELIRFDALNPLRAPNVRVTNQRWLFSVSNRTYRLEGRIWAPRDYFVGLNYLDPDGALHHCLNSKVATAELKLFYASGKGKPLLRLRADHSCALEILAEPGTHGVKIHA